MQGDLVRRAQSGDAEAFDVLASGAYDGLFSVAHRILRDVDQSNDAVQECLVRAWRDLRGLREVHRFDAWLRRLLVHACHDEGRRLRSRGREVRLLSFDRAAPGDAARDLADRDQLERAFLRLPVAQRAVLVMHHYLSLTVPEIAETLGIPPGTVRSRLHYATLAMRAVLEADARAAMVAEGERSA
jgi:RNA polymerase sigma-70 factor (ECF subfamily)